MHLDGSLHLGMFVLEEASCVCCLTSPVVVSFIALPLGVERKALHPPSPGASSTTAAGTSEEEGLHACPLPHIFEVAFCLISGNFGGGRIGTSPFLLTTPVSTSEEEGTGHPPHNVREYLGGGRTGLPPHTVGVYFMHMVGNSVELNTSTFPDLPCGNCRGQIERSF